MQSRAGSKKNLYHPVTNLEVALSSPFFKVDIEAYFHWICSTESIVSHRFMVKTQKKKFRKLKLNYAYCNVHTWRFLTFWLEFQESSRHEMTNKTETFILVKKNSRKLRLYFDLWSILERSKNPFRAS